MRTPGPGPAPAATWPRRAAPALASAPAVLAYPFWLIALSYRLPGHLADRAGSAEIVPSRLMGGGLNA